MRQNENFILKRCAGLTLLVPVGKAAISFPGMISLNETGAFLWEALGQDQSLESLAALLAERFQVTEQQAAQDTAHFLDKLTRAGALLDEIQNG